MVTGGWGTSDAPGAGFRALPFGPLLGYAVAHLSCPVSMRICPHPRSTRPRVSRPSHRYDLAIDGTDPIAIGRIRSTKTRESMASLPHRNRPRHSGRLTQGAAFPPTDPRTELACQGGGGPPALRAPAFAPCLFAPLLGHAVAHLSRPVSMRICPHPRSTRTRVSRPS